MNEIQKNLESNRQVFLNQASYEAAVMLSIKNLPSSISSLKGLCELNSKKFLPYWGLVMEKITSPPLGYFELFMSMVYGIRPFLDNRSSFKAPSCAFETLSQSIERHLQRIINWTCDFYKSDIHALKLARIILKHSGRNIQEDYTVLCKELISLFKKKRDYVDWEEELSKFICLLLTNVIHLDESEFTFLEQLYSEFIMKALVRKFPLRYQNSVSIFNDEIVFEYILGALDTRLDVSPIILERVLKDDTHVRKLIPQAERMNNQALMILVNNCRSCLVDLCKHAPPEFRSILLDNCIETRDLNALANLLNLTLDRDLLKRNEQRIVDFVQSKCGFESLRCWLGLTKNGVPLHFSVIEDIRANFVITNDPKKIIVMSMIMKLTGGNISLEPLKRKLEEFADNSRVQKHLLSLIEG